MSNSATGKPAEAGVINMPVGPSNGVSEHLLPHFSVPPPQYMKASSFEYIFFVSWSVIVNLVGFIYFYRVGKRIAPLVTGHYYYTDNDEIVLAKCCESGKPLKSHQYSPANNHLRPPSFPFSYLGSVGLDVNDGQWRVFHDTLSVSILGLLLFVAVGRLIRHLCSESLSSAGAGKSSTAVCEASSEAAASGFSEDREAESSYDGDTAPRRSSSRSGQPTLRVNSNSSTFAPKGERSNCNSPKDPLLESSSTSNDKRLFLHRMGRYLKLDLVLQPMITKKVPMYAYHILAGMGVTYFISGPCFFFEIVLIFINYFFISKLDKRGAPFALCMAVMWFFMVATLFINDYYKGYSFRLIFGASRWASRLDWAPKIMKWTTHYNMTVMRMIAFNTDAWEARSGTNARAPHSPDLSPGEKRCQELYEKHEKTCVDCAILREQNPSIIQSLDLEQSRLGDPSEIEGSRLRRHGRAREFLQCYKCRSEAPRELADYNVLGYLGYIFYPPLFLSGPMVTYNAYVSFVAKPTQSFSPQRLLAYGARAGGNIVFMIAFMHYFFVPTLLLDVVNRNEAAKFGFTVPSPSSTSSSTNAISILELFSLEEKAYLLYVALAFLYCKFNTVWKVFRFFALLDGFDPPEDMPHCFSNTVSITDFWQSWHASFNLWIVRYMYIPMGGNKRKLLTLVPIFLFIAIWHDIELRLLHWALFMCACFVPEIAIMTFFTKTKIKFIANWRSQPLVWRRIKEVGATIGEWALILANLIGFSTGGSATMNTVANAWKSGISTPFLCCFLLFYIGTGKISVRYREVQAYEMMCKKQRLGIQR